MPSDNPKNLTGTLLNQRYRLEALLGQGGMGEVYRARDTLLKRDVAVKVLTHQSLGTSGRARHLREAQYIANLNHPNIVTVYDVGEYDDLPFIVMELVEGHTLHETMPDDLGTIVGIVSDICTALQHAHEQGIIHRDIKPENVLLDQDGKVKLMDFGIAMSAASRLTEEGTLFGTVFYISPEQALGKHIDQRSDLYSLGVMLYELVCGRLPFEADDPLSVITQHLHAPVVPPRAKNDQIPPALEALILQLMQKDPADRPASVKDVLEQLSAPEILDANALPTEELSIIDRIVQGRLVGREQELRQARQIWGQAVNGKGQLLLISGEPGVGKTRLMREIVTLAEVGGGKALIGSSYAEGNPPYAPFRLILRDAIRVAKETGLETPEEVLIELVKIIPELRASFPDLPERQAEDPKTEQQRLFDQVLFFFNLLTSHMPVLLVLEDAHWSDNSTLMLLRHLVRSTRTQRLVVLVTYREVELDEARSLHEILLDFNREKLGTRIKLNRLNRQETRDMLAILFAEEITQEFLDGIYTETEGNPFFIEEVCKAIVESGKLTYQDGHWKRLSIEEIGVPQSIQIAIQSRLRVLSEIAQSVLEQAAILGRKFDFQTLLYAMSIDEDSLLDALDEALYAKLVEETRKDVDDRFAFIHALIPTTIAAGLRTLKRRRLHKRAAQALERLQPDAYEALAYQYIEAGETNQGVDYLVQAGDRARSLFAHQEAINNYQQALGHLREEGEMVQAARTLMKLGLTYHIEFKFPEARRAYEEAFNLWQRAGRLEEGDSLPPAPHALRGLIQEPVSIDPGLSHDGWATHVIDNLFSGLVSMNSSLEVVPDVAQRWEVLDGGRRYLFHLREDVTWSDGVPVSAHDFEFAWKRILDPANRSGESEHFFVIKHAREYYQGDLGQDAVGVHSRGDFTLEVELERPYNALLDLLSTKGMCPVPRHVVQEYGSAWTDPKFLVTNGPFRLAAWETGESMTLEANPTYHGSFTGNLQRVEMYFFSDQQTNMGKDLYQDNGIDYLWVDYSPGTYDLALSKFPEEFRTAPYLMTGYFGFNIRQPPFDDLRVRKAFALATDREYLNNAVWGARTFPASGGYLPFGMPGYSEGIALPYDPEQARCLLAEAGYPGGRGFPVIECKASGRFLKIIKDHWQVNLGIEINESDLSWERFLELALTDHQNLHLWAIGTPAGFPDPYAYLRGLSGTGSRTGWSHDSYDGLLNRAAETMDYTDRLKLYRQAEQILVEEVPVLPISYSRSNVLIKPWVSKLPISPIGGWYWKEVILEPH